MSAIKKPVNYLNNKDLLKEIHQSKNSYCTFQQAGDDQYDVIIDVAHKNINEVFNQLRDADIISQAKSSRAVKLSIETGMPVTADSVTDDQIIFRVMSWDHIPLSPRAPKKVVKKKTAREILDLDEDDDLFGELEADAPEDIDDMIHTRVNFPPFQHFRLINGEPQCIGKSHWTGDLVTGDFSKDHGKLTDKLARMYLMICEKYAMKYNWRGYCVDETTEALTQRGWLNIDQITTDDQILSYNGSAMAWSSIKSIFRDHYQGQMFHLTVQGYDSLITPQHRILTERGLVPVDLLVEKDRVILMGESEQGSSEKYYSDDLVELMGWIITEGCYELGRDNKIKNISIYQNSGPEADRIRKNLRNLEFSFSENIKKDKKNIQFRIFKKSSQEITSILPEKNLTMDFILKLTAAQRELLIKTMIDGDGWYRSRNQRSFAQKSTAVTDLFVALCSLAGIRTSTYSRDNSAYVDKPYSFGIGSEYNVVNLFSKRRNVAIVENMDFHGAKRNGRKHLGLGKITHPNEPTVPYTGRVWCPTTEYGCFLARRNGTVYLTGNSYLEEMVASAVLQLTYVGLRFNESKSSNPFAYFTQTITNSFCRVLNTEKRNQNIRDDILELNNLNPSYSRANQIQTADY